MVGRDNFLLGWPIFEGELLNLEAVECIYPLKTSILGHFNVQRQVSSLRVVGFSLPCFGLEDSVDTNFPLMDIRWSRIPSLDLNSVTSWWFQPIRKILVKMGIFPQVEVKMKNI